MIFIMSMIQMTVYGLQFIMVVIIHSLMGRILIHLDLLIFYKIYIMHIILLLKMDPLIVLMKDYLNHQIHITTKKSLIPWIQTILVIVLEVTLLTLMIVLMKKCYQDHQILIIIKESLIPGMRASLIILLKKRKVHKFYYLHINL